MDAHNIAAVRATNAIPFDGKVYPVKDVPFIKKEKGTAFSGEMFSLLRRKGLLNEIDGNQPEEERIDLEEKNKSIVEHYMPYTSVYNSMVLWSLNCLVPDDAFNKFSEKSCAIIEGVEELMEQSEVYSLVPTDTATDGPVKLSENAIILIVKEVYEKLSEEEKESLAQLDCKVSVFEGNLKTAINRTLTETGRYTAETLTLVNENGGYIKSATSEAVMQVINNISKEKDIPQILHDRIFKGAVDGSEKLEHVKGEIEQCNVVAAFYKQTFFEYLFSKMDIDETTKIYAQMAPEAQPYMENLCDEISRIGIEEYKKVVDTYNYSLEQLKESGKLPTPQEIVDAAKENKKIDLISMIEELEKKSEENGGKVSVKEIKEVAEGVAKTSRDGARKAMDDSKEETIEKEQ